MLNILIIYDEISDCINTIFMSVQAFRIINNQQYN